MHVQMIEHINYNRYTGRVGCSPGGCALLQLAQQQVREEEGAEVVGAPHRLKAFLREVVRHEEHAGIVHQHVQGQVLGQEGVRKGLD